MALAPVAYVLFNEDHATVRRRVAGQTVNPRSNSFGGCRQPDRAASRLTLTVLRIIIRGPTIAALLGSDRLV